MQALLLKNGTVATPAGLINADVLLKDGKIAAIGTDLTAPDAKEIDVSDRLVAPGLIDVHVHYRDPGLTHKETISTGTKAAAHGGFTTTAAMPNVKPVVDTPELVAKQVARNAEKAHINVLQYSAITKNLSSDDLVDFEGVKQAGAFAVSNDGCGVQTAQTMYLAMQRAAAANLPICAHVEDDSLAAGGVINAGATATKLGLPGIDDVSESSQIARDLVLAQKTGVHYHICHISTKTSVELVRLAKQHGINVTCEVTPHHLLLNDSQIDGTDGNYKMNPPLRSREDQEALLAGLADGTIDMIATDHAPHTEEEKAGDLRHACFGIVGIEQAFSLLYTKLVQTNQVSLPHLIKLMSTNPAGAFNLNAKGQLAVGRDADIAVFDLKHTAPITAAGMYSKGKNTPFIGTEVAGWTAMTIVGGKVVYTRED